LSQNLCWRSNVRFNTTTHTTAPVQKLRDARPPRQSPFPRFTPVFAPLWVLLLPFPNRQDRSLGKFRSGRSIAWPRYRQSCFQLRALLTQRESILSQTRPYMFSDARPLHSSSPHPGAQFTKVYFRGEINSSVHVRRAHSFVQGKLKPKRDGINAACLIPSCTEPYLVRF